MSLARRLMNGEIGGLNVSIDESRYSADNGAAMIAMESAAELYSIAQEFYNYEQADISAIVEGVALEGSQYEPVAEASIKNAFTKIKEFLQKLWAKIKVWFKNVAIFLDALFKSGKDFVKKYKDQISSLKSVKLENVKIWDYSDMIDTPFDISIVEKDADDIINSALSNVTGSNANNIATAKAATNEKLEKDLSDLDERMNTGMYEEESDGNASTAEEFSKYCYNVFRGIESSDTVDQPSRTITESDIKAFAKKLENCPGADSIKTTRAKVDAMFKNKMNMIKQIEAHCENNAKKYNNNETTSTGYSNYAKIAQSVSKCVSKLSSITTTVINAQKAAMKERDTAYKMVISMGLRSANRDSVK